MIFSISPRCAAEKSCAAAGSAATASAAAATRGRAKRFIALVLLGRGCSSPVRGGMGVVWVGWGGAGFLLRGGWCILLPKKNFFFFSSSPTLPPPPPRRGEP